LKALYINILTLFGAILSYNFLSGVLSYLIVWFFLLCSVTFVIDKSKWQVISLFLSLLIIKYFSLLLSDFLTYEMLQRHVLRDFTFLLFSLSICGVLRTLRFDLLLQLIVFFLIFPSSLISLGQLYGMNLSFGPSNNIVGSNDLKSFAMGGYGFPGVFSSVNIAAYFYSVGATLCFCLPFSWIRRIIGTIILLALVSLGNRSGVVAFVVAVVCFLVLRRKLWTLLSILIIATLFLQSFDASALRLSSMTNSRDGIGSLVLQTLVNNPFIGNPKYFHSLMEISGYDFLSPHNFIFYVVVNTGLTGLLILTVTAFLRVININWRLLENHLALAVFIAYYSNALVHNFSPLHGDWLGVLVCFGFFKVYRNEASVVRIA